MTDKREQRFYDDEGIRIYDHEINQFNRDHIRIHRLVPGHDYRLEVHLTSPEIKEPAGVWDLVFQNGPVKETGANGITDEALIAVVLDRLRYFQTEHEGGKFRCRENALCITKLEEALHWLQHRAQERERRGVEGTHEV